MANKTKELTEREQLVLDFIPFGKDGKINVSEIAKLAELEQRTVYTIIESLIHNHKIPIVSSRHEHDNGIFIPLSDEERQEGLTALRNQVRTMYRRIELVETADLNIVYEYKDIPAI